MHLPVLVEEVLASLKIVPEGCYVDLTFGRGGHSQAILQRLGPGGRLIALDRDKSAVAFAQTGPFDDDKFSAYHANFSELSHIITQLDLMGCVDGILMDLGVSSPQLDDPSRGFSFVNDGPLDMRMNIMDDMNAASWLNQADEKDIADVLWRYGQERFSRRIAKAIVIARDKEPLATTLQLTKVIVDAMPKYYQKIHPATRSFQAIRCFINQELEALDQVLDQVLDVLKIGGRLAAISFHSLEDTRVKRFIRKHATSDLPVDIPLRPDEQPTLRLQAVNGLIRPGEEEIRVNPRSRSSRLRVAKRVA